MNAWPGSLSPNCPGRTTANCLQHSYTAVDGLWLVKTEEQECNLAPLW